MVKKKILILLIFFVLTVIFPNIYAEIITAHTLKNNNIKFERITSESGLSQNSVLSILQDPKGFMLFGTYSGLNKYDGHRFILYESDTADPGSLSGNSISHIILDSSGVIWIGTAENGLNKYEREKDRFKQYKNNPDDPDRFQ